MISEREFFPLVLSPHPAAAVLLVLFDYYFFSSFCQTTSLKREREETTETESTAILFDVFLLYEFVSPTSSSSNQFNFDRIDTTCVRAYGGRWFFLSLSLFIDTPFRKRGEERKVSLVSLLRRAHA